MFTLSIASGGRKAFRKKIPEPRNGSVPIGIQVHRLYIDGTQDFKSLLVFCLRSWNVSFEKASIIACLYFSDHGGQDSYPEKESVIKI